MAIDGKYGRVQIERGSIGEEEPVIVFRARDALVPEMLRYYLQLCTQARSPERHLALVEGDINAMVEWQKLNSARVPTSDGASS